MNYRCHDCGQTFDTASAYMSETGREHCLECALDRSLIKMPRWECRWGHPVTEEQWLHIDSKLPKLLAGLQEWLHKLMTDRSKREMRQNLWSLLRRNHQKCETCGDRLPLEDWLKMEFDTDSVRLVRVLDTSW